MATWAFQMRAPSMCSQARCSVDDRPQRLDVGGAQDRTAGEVVGVLDRHHPRLHEERAHVGCPHGPDRVDVDAAARVGPGAHGQPAVCAVRAELGAGDVRRRLAEHFRARPGAEPHREHVGHRPGGREQRSLLAEQAGDPLLELADRGVLAVHVVADRCGGHRRPHRVGGLGEGVGAEVDHGANLPPRPRPPAGDRCCDAPVAPARRLADAGLALPLRPTQPARPSRSAGLRPSAASSPRGRRARGTAHGSGAGRTRTRSGRRGRPRRAPRHRRRTR